MNPIQAEVKRIEVRDRMTFIPAIAVRLVVNGPLERHVGFRDGAEVVWFGRLGGGSLVASWLDWHCPPRTMPEAHRILSARWNDFADSDVLDVEYELGESRTKRSSDLDCKDFQS